jgi:hypothetical protein
MSSITSSPNTNHSADSSIWENLKQAISTSSGFQRWKLDCQVDESSQDYSLDTLVYRYLRETLETLAY